VSAAEVRAAPTSPNGNGDGAVGIAASSEETLQDFTLEIDVDVATQQRILDGTVAGFVDGGVEELPRFVHNQLFLGARDAKGRRRDRGQDLFQGCSIFRATRFEEVLGREGINVDRVDFWST
jgi:hypothetical protein